MTIFILFLLACLALQEAVNWWRGEPEVRVRMGEPGFDMSKAELHVGSTHAVAECGCDFVDNKVMKPCKAHEMLRRVSND